MKCQFPFTILFKQRAAERRAFEDRLDEMVLLQGFGQILVHLSLDTLLSVTHHGVGR
jgi:hypothetical protein